MISELEIAFCTYFKNLTKFRFKSETYSEPTLFCLKSGSFSYSIGEGETKIATAPAVIYCPPHKSFKREIRTTAELCMIKFTSPDEPAEGEQKLSDPTRFGFNMLMLESCIYCHHPVISSIHLHYCKDIIYSLLTVRKENTPIDKAAEYIEKNFASDISVTDLAKETGFTAVHFINTFKKQYGLTPKAYILALRIRQAKQLLSFTDKPFKEIALLCGFSDELYFSRFFKKTTGLTPTQFKASAEAS